MNAVKPAFEYSVVPDFSGKTIWALIVAGGSSTRMKGTNKLFVPLLGTPVIARTLTAFEHCDEISGIVISARSEDIPDIQRICSEYDIKKLRSITAGGATRAQSVANAVNECGDDVGYFAIHDAARPLVTGDVIRRTAEAAIRLHAAAPAIPVTDTVKKVDENMHVLQTPDRNRLYAAQTPQIFEAGLYRKALETGGDYTDDCALVESLGATVTLVEGDRRNIKITTPEDVAVAEALLMYIGKDE